MKQVVFKSEASPIQCYKLIHKTIIPWTALRKYYLRIYNDTYVTLPLPSITSGVKWWTHISSILSSHIILYLLYENMTNSKILTLAAVFVGSRYVPLYVLTAKEENIKKCFKFMPKKIWAPAHFRRVLVSWEQPYKFQGILNI